MICDCSIITDYYSQSVKKYERSGWSFLRSKNWKPITSRERDRKQRYRQSSSNYQQMSLDAQVTYFPALSPLELSQLSWGLRLFVVVLVEINNNKNIIWITVDMFVPMYYDIRWQLDNDMTPGSAYIIVMCVLQMMYKCSYKVDMDNNKLFIYFIYFDWIIVWFVGRCIGHKSFMLPIYLLKTRK